MKSPIDLRPALLRLALLCAAALCLGLLLPVYSMASQDGPHTEEPGSHTEELDTQAGERVTHAEERATQRAEEKAARIQEREARRTARSEERTARRNAPESGQNASGEPGTGRSAPKSNTQPSETTARECSISIQASSQRIIAGETVTVSGALTCPAAASAASQQVELYEHQSGAGAQSFAAVETVTTAVDGSYEFTSPALEAGTVLQVRAGRHRARVVVKVAPLVTLTASSASNTQSSAADAQPHLGTRAKATFSGTVDPAVEGARVALQVAYPAAGEHWRTVAYGSVGEGGSYSIEHAFRIPGEANLRTIVHLKGPGPAGISEAIAYDIPQPQNPQLTIQTTVDPLSYGQQVTISGVAAGAGGQPVKLLARTQQGNSSVVAEATTGEDGSYSFAEEPLENTTYQVTDATERSTAVFEGVSFALTPESPPTTAQRGQLVTFSGTLTGAPEGQAVYLERGNASGLDFHVVATGAAGAASRYQLAYAFSRTGVNEMRIRIPDDGHHEGDASAPFSVTVAG